MPEAFPETYLGDGLYASFDGHYLRLRAPHENGNQWVKLEPEMINLLVSYIAKLVWDGDLCPAMGTLIQQILDHEEALTLKNK